MKKTIFPFVVAGFAIGFCLDAAAQLKEGAPVKFSVDASVELTDNRDSETDGESNTDFYLRPRLDGISDWGRGSVNFYYEPAFRYRSNPSDIQNYNELQHDLGVDIEHKPVRRLTLDVSERFARTDDPSIQRGGATLRRDSSYMYNWAGAGLKVMSGKHTYFDTGFKHMIKKYDEAEIAEESDEDSITGSLLVWHQATRALGLMAECDYTAFGYEHTSEIVRDFESLSAGIGMDKIFGKVLRGSARLGWRRFTYEDDALPSDEAPYATMDIHVSPVAERRFTGGITYSLKNSDAFPHSSQKYSSVHARAEADVRSLTFGVSAELRLGEYDIDTVPQEAVDRVTGNPASYPAWVQHFINEGQTSGNEETFMGSFELGYRIDPNTGLKLGYHYEDVKSDVGVTFDRNSVSLAFSRDF